MTSHLTSNIAATLTTILKNAVNFRGAVLAVLVATALTACGGDNGSIDAVEQSATLKSAKAAASVGAITLPPANLHANPYYTKYIDASGIPILANGVVADAALIKMQYIVQRMVERDPWTRDALVRNLKAVLIIPSGRGMTSLPEYSNFDASWNDRAQGVGWTQSLPYSSCSEANLVHAGYPLDRYVDESICVHEFAHTVFDAGIVARDSGAQIRLNNLYQAAVKSGYLGNSYAAATVSEYWAEGVQAWFNAASCSNRQSSTICTNSELWQKDPGLWQEIGSWFPLPPAPPSQSLYP
jgi:hypothetical protein